MPTPKKQKNGKWSCQVYIGKDKNGKRKYKRVTADTKDLVNLEVAQLKVQGVKEDKEARTVRDVVGEYIRSVEAVISPTTLRGYIVTYHNGFPHLMDMDISIIDNAVMQKAVNEETKRITKYGKAISPKTISNEYGLIEVALKRMCDMTFRVKLPQVPIKIKEFPDPQEIINAIKGTSSELPCLLAMWLGLRMGEIKGIDCSAIRDGVLHIEQTRVYKDGHEEIKPTAKNDTSIRNIALPKKLMQLIESTNAYINYCETGENRPLIATPRNRIYKRWKRIAIDHGWQMSFHDLRAVNASVGIVLGIPDKYMMSRNGYKTDYTLKKRYQQLFDTQRKIVDQRIDDYFDQLFN